MPWRGGWQPGDDRNESPVQTDAAFVSRSIDMNQPFCPLCNAGDPQLSVRRDAIPVLQNIVYPTREAALTAPCGSFELGTCRVCGFSWNTRFDAARIVYDQRYDNHNASAMFTDHYRQLSRMLIDRFDIRDGTVYDIGCGKGEFLRVFASLAPNVRCIGIDPSCTPVSEGNFELRAMRFDASAFAGDARLVLLRHVLEHIDQPREFVASLAAAMPNAPLFVEVPDLDWILRSNAFWDFCYEHCNYFTPMTLAATLVRAGFAVLDQQRCFGDQYQWALAMPGVMSTPGDDPASALAAVSDYQAAEASAIARLTDFADRCSELLLWGMSTKGVIVSVLLGADRIAGTIDLNLAKQGRFAAGSGVAISAPERLASAVPGATVLVMNPNYLDEITAIVAQIRRDLVVTALR